MFHNFINIWWHVITHWADSTDSSEAQNIAFKITFKKSFKFCQMSNVFIIFIYGCVCEVLSFAFSCWSSPLKWSLLNSMRPWKHWNM